MAARKDLIDMSGHRYGTLVVTTRAGAYRGHRTWVCQCDCGTQVTVRTDHLKTGYVRSCGDRIMHPIRKDAGMGYNAAHRKIRRILGSASENECADGCGRWATDWSYDQMDPNEVRSPGGRFYSTDPAFYVARCRYCHSAYDAQRAKVPMAVLDHPAFAGLRAVFEEVGA